MATILAFPTLPPAPAIPPWPRTLDDLLARMTAERAELAATAAKAPRTKGVEATFPTMSWFERVWSRKPYREDGVTIVHDESNDTYIVTTVLYDHAITYGHDENVESERIAA